MRVAESGRMSSTSSKAWDRLQTLLSSLEPNAMITLDDVVTDTGLSPEMVRLVLNGLTVAGLFEEPSPNVFVRRSLPQSTLVVTGGLVGQAGQVGRPGRRNG
jgi:hypothetical protein